MGTAIGLGAALLVLAVPVLCMTTAVRLLTGTAAFYDWGQARRVVAAEPGPAQRQAASRALIRYFGSEDGSLPQELLAASLPADFFNERELSHLSDVRALIQGAGCAQEMAMVAGGVGLLLLGWAGHRRALGRALRWGAYLTVGLLGLLGAATLLDFESLFLRFHWLSFANDLWRLDPRTDVLIRIYPPSFFFDATLAAAGLAAVQAMAVMAAGVLLGRRTRG